MIILLQSDEEYLRYHMTSVKDIELLTGIKFFKNIALHESIQLTTQQPLSVWQFRDPEPIDRKIWNWGQR